jgi:ketosteroid isomerase-like protein
MKYRLAVLMLSAVVLLASCTVWREHQVTDFKDATGGEGLERSFWKQVRAKRWNALDAHLASNYISVTPEEGRFDRAAALAHLQQLQLEEFTLGDLQTELNTDTLVVTYAISMRGTFGGQPLPQGPVRMMTVWQKQKAGWMAIAHSVLGPQTMNPQAPPIPDSQKK